MTKLYNRKSDKLKRNILRKNMTEAERELWQYIRKRQINGVKFRRQYSIKGFVLDFYSPAIKLAIEIDGGYHDVRSQQTYDRDRQKLFESIGITFLRFSNKEVLSKQKLVISKIKQGITALYSSP